MTPSAPLDTAKTLYESIDNQTRISLDYAADAAVNVIERLEPQLWNPADNEPLYLDIQPDSAGISGDVRDIVCLRKQTGWQIGLSCKHNHHAVKHSRLSDTIDFGKEWLSIPCSDVYFSKVVPLFTALRNKRDQSAAAGHPVLWKDVYDKAGTYYRPILQAFIDELVRIYHENEKSVPESLIRYLLGRDDFYKVITDDKNRTTRVEGVNISGTLNADSGNERSIAKVPLLKMPSRFYHIGFKEGSDNTIEVVCDEGWQISMRIHNASSRVEPSLKFDVQLISFPASIYAQTEPWDTADNASVDRIRAYSKRITGCDLT